MGHCHWYHLLIVSVLFARFGNPSGCVPHPTVHYGALRGAESADQSALQPVREIDVDLNARMD